MKINIPERLKILSEHFPVPIYAVGGFVRDVLLGFEPSDVDLAAPLAPEEVKKILSGTEFKVKDGSKKLMTLIIKDGDISYEYTAFRFDSYAGGHRPAEVIPCTDIRTDATRRDFTVNAIYCDIKTGEIVDPLGGLKDLEDRVLRTARKASEVFGEDGLRLMRLARFAASLGFEIDAEALAAAKDNKALIDEISKERVRDELDKILVCDKVYGVENAHYNGLKILDEIGVLERILPDLCLGKGMAQRSDYHAYDVFEHIMQVVKFAPPDVRLAALMHDIAKPKMMMETGRYHGHDKAGGPLTRQILAGLKYPNSVIEETARLVENHMFNLNCDAKENTLRRFVLHNRDIVEKLTKLEYADFYGSGKTTATNNRSADLLTETLKEMQNEKIPFSVSELLVKGTDLLKIPQLAESKRGAALEALLDECVLKNAKLDTKEKQMDFIEKYARRQ